MIEVRKLLEYNDLIRHRYFKCFTKLPWKEFINDRGASWGSIRNIFIHTLNATDYWLDFLQQENFCSRKRFDDYKTFDEVKAYMEHVEERMRNYLNSLSTNGLQKKYTVKNDAGEIAETVTAEDVLIHVFEEEVHHRGEIIALLWQINVEPPPMGWERL